MQVRGRYATGSFHTRSKSVAEISHSDQVLELVTPGLAEAAILVLYLLRPVTHTGPAS